MTGDVEECSLVQISPSLGHTESTEACTSEIQNQNIAYINSNMAVDNNCVFTAAIPADLAGSFPEGMVLQIVPDSTMVAMTSMNEQPTSIANPVIFKNSTFSSETVTSQTALSLSNLLTDSGSHNESHSVETAICSEGNMSDIDLSFLNEPVEASVIPDSKCLRETTSKGQNQIINPVSTQPIDILQNSLTDNNVKTKELDQANLKLDSEKKNPSNDLVMIDVTKPIQLSQNSLIMVNGQKCVLQHDPQSGQVIAYPVKEQEKTRRKRGRPRKESVEQNAKSSEQNVNVLAQEQESWSEDEREKGLLEVVNDDGALVRRSSRKRKRAKILNDYETGNLKQELGSDGDDVDLLDLESDLHTRRRKGRGPGRPRKYSRSLETVIDNTINNADDMKRQRGRPRKIAPNSEPTQAFLVQTADGQTLMMQVPLSSIPPGISLQEMAQEIANKLNFGINQAIASSVVKETNTNEADSVIQEKPLENVASQTAIVPVSEPLQDHSIGSTTNGPLIHHLRNLEENSESVVDSSCKIINDMDPAIVESFCDSEMAVLDDCFKTNDVNSNLQNIIPENLLNDSNNINTINVPPCSLDNSSINITSTTSSSTESTSVLYNLIDSMSNQLCTVKSHETSLNENMDIDTNQNSKPLKSVLKKNIEKSINSELILQNNPNINNEMQSLKIDNTTDKNSVSTNVPGCVLNINKNFELINQNNSSAKEHMISQLASSTGLVETSSESVLQSEPEQESSKIASSTSTDCLQIEVINENVENEDIEQNVYLNSQDNSVLNNLSDELTSQFVKSEITCVENQVLEDIFSKIPATKTSITNEFQTSTVAVSSRAMFPAHQKAVSILIPPISVKESKKCKICQVPYITEEELTEHFKSNHPKCICDVCNYMAEHASTIKRHSYRHTNGNCTCKICGKKYKDLYILKMHIKMIHMPLEVLYTCQTCEKKFSRKAHLKRHLRIHAPVKQFQCPRCEYKGCEKSDITKHLLIHEAPKFKCEICGKAFRHLKNKDLHLKRHSGQKDYKCGICDHYGYTFTDIRKHIERRHTACCSRCGQIFKSTELLKEHKKMGLCQPDSIGDVIKVDEKLNVITENKTSALDKLPLEIMDTEHPQIMCRISECSEQTLSALQNGQIIMTSVEGLLSGQNGQLIIEGLEDNLITSDTFSVISTDKDSNKMVTLVSSGGKNCSLSLDSVESVSSSAENNKDTFILPTTE